MSGTAWSVQALWSLGKLKVWRCRAEDNTIPVSECIDRLLEKLAVYCGRLIPSGMLPSSEGGKPELRDWSLGFGELVKPQSVGLAFGATISRMRSCDYT